MQMKKSILLLGSYGRGNAGDDAFLLALTKLFGKYEITINSANDSRLPEEIRGRVETINTDANKDLLKKMRLFLSVDYVVYGGGDLWVELHGEKYPRTSLWKMVLVNLLSKIFRKKIFYLGCGAAQLKGQSLALARLSASLADRVAARDEKTADILRIKDAKIFPDLAVNLFTKDNSARGKRKDKFLVGISLLYFLPKPHVNFKIAVKSICKLIKSLPRDKFRFVLIPMLISEKVRTDDLWVARQIKLFAHSNNIKIFKFNEVSKLVELFSKIDLMVGARLHANILAALAGTPCLGISYRDKVRNFFTESSLENYCLDLKNLKNLNKKFNEMVNNYDNIKEQFLEAREGLLEKKCLYEEFVSENFV